MSFIYKKEKAVDLEDETLESLLIKNFTQQKIVKLDQIGIVFLAKRETQYGRNPQTGSIIELPGRVLPVFLAFGYSDSRYSSGCGTSLTEASFEENVQREKFVVHTYMNTLLIHEYKSCIPNGSDEPVRLTIKDKNKELIFVLDMRYLKRLESRLPSGVEMNCHFSKKVRTEVVNLKTYVNIQTKINEKYGYFEDSDVRIPWVVDLVGLTK